MTLTSRSRRFAASVAGASAGLLALGLLAAAPAAATASPAVINPGNVPATAEEYDKGETCYYTEGTDPKTVDAWHFVAPGQGATIESLTAYFSSDADLSTIEATIVADDSNSVQEPSDKHLYLITKPGWTLVDATATIGNASVTLKSGAFFFVLSHACAGEGGGGDPEAAISGLKYYDANRNGQFDEDTEDGIGGWPIDFDGSTLITEADGTFSTLVDPGTYSVSEFLAEAPWVQTGNTVDQTIKSGGASATLTDKAYSVTLVDDSSVSGLNFGNVCEITNTNGLTLGYWSNKNGQARITDAALQMLRDLNLRNANGSNFDPTTKTQLKNWLLAATATNAAYMTSAQMAALSLNIMLNGLNEDDLIYVNGSWMSIADAIDAADALLGMYGVVLDGSPVRAEMLAYKDAFDDLNNNRATITPGTADRCPAPVFDIA